ncbi:hypothetical protein [Patiriisocius marinistellae]|nr:hypothetical protein [Patiriisocius marinistellae]
MKHFFSLLLITSIYTNIYAQNKSDEEIVARNIQDLDKPPIYPGCEHHLFNDALKKCMSYEMRKHILVNFNKRIADSLLLEGIQKIYISFKINKEGDVVNIKARAPHPLLINEGERVISLLPKMTPGYLKEKAVSLLYALPIVFKVENLKETPKEKRKRLRREKRSKNEN